MSCNFLSGHHFVNNILIFNKFMSLSKATNAPKYVGANIFKLSTPALLSIFCGYQHKNKNRFKKKRSKLVGVTRLELVTSTM